MDLYLCHLSYLWQAFVCLVVTRVNSYSCFYLFVIIRVFLIPIKSFPPIIHTHLRLFPFIDYNKKRQKPAGCVSAVIESTVLDYGAAVTVLLLLVARRDSRITKPHSPIRFGFWRQTPKRMSRLASNELSMLSSRASRSS